MTNSQKHFSIGKKMYLFIVATILVAVFGTAGISYNISVNQIDRYYKNITYNSAQNFASLLNPEFFAALKEVALSEEYQEIRDKAEEEDIEQPIEDYLRKEGLWEDYQNSRNLLVKYLRNMQDIKYLYVVVFGDADALYDMYLMDDDENPIYATGYYEVREVEFYGVDSSQRIEPTISNGDWGWLCSAYAPVYAEDGSVICHVGCDFDMEEVMTERQHFFMYIALGALILTIFILVGAVFFVNKTVINPLNAITLEMKKFTPSENTSYEKSGVVQMDIHSRDEIEDIYQEIRSMQIRIIDYLNDLSVLQKDKEKAEHDIKDKEEQIGKISQEAYRDALTSVGSKIAYVKKSEELNEKIVQGTAKFALVMVDLNDLKKINDNYGHKAGDMYIKNCCHMICEVYKHSPVFRIGGDEFIVILEGTDYDNRLQHLQQLKNMLEKTYTQKDADPWEQCSASLGMAEPAFDDNTVELVFKRADRAMYEDKKQFKEKHGSYR